MSDCIGCGRTYDSFKECCDECWRAPWVRERAQLQERILQLQGENDQLQARLGGWKRPVRSSNISLRFYLRDGWTHDGIGKVLMGTEYRFFDDPGDQGYWVMMPGYRPPGLIEQILRHGTIFTRDGEPLEGEEARRHVDDHLI